MHSPSFFLKNGGTSMIGRSQVQTEIALDLAEEVLPARSA
jgi:hypothetical protein